MITPLNLFSEALSNPPTWLPRRLADVYHTIYCFLTVAPGVHFGPASSFSGRLTQLPV